ncbi:MAG: hypothetical protein V1772_12680, partial [Chloroflexota bacterium]
MNDLPAETPQGANLAYLRGESLRSIALLCGAIGYVWITLALRPSLRPLALAGTWWGALALILTASLAFALRRRTRQAAALLMTGCLAAVICPIVVFSDLSYAFFFAVPLILAGILLGQYALLPVYLLSNLAVIGLDLWRITPGSLSPLVVQPLAALALVALASYLSVQNLFVALTWVWAQYDRSQQMERVA